jgi:hypothetical protein
MKLSLNMLLGIILFATLTRIAIPPMLGHLPNFSALDALALFCGAHCSKRLFAIAITLASVWFGDLLINHSMNGQWELFYDGWYWQYASYVVITLLGSALIGNIKILNVAAASVSAAVLFFAISNFGVWFSGTLYPLTLDGLVACYVAAIPFFQNTLLSDVVFSAALFGIFALPFSLHNRTTNLDLPTYR